MTSTWPQYPTSPPNFAEVSVTLTTPPWLMGIRCRAADVDPSTRQMYEASYIIRHQLTPGPHLGREGVWGHQYVHVRADKLVPVIHPRRHRMIFRSGPGQTCGDVETQSLFSMIGSSDFILRLTCEDGEESTKDSCNRLNRTMRWLWRTAGRMCLGQNENGYIMRHMKPHEPSATRHIDIHGPFAPVRPERSEEVPYAL
jgi:hypothetical protein